MVKADIIWRARSTAKRHDAGHATKDPALPEEMAASMKELAPAAHAFKVALAATIDIERRAYSQLHDAIFLSDDRSVCSVGISSRYPAPPHRDRTDVAFTWAFVGKCGSRRQRCTTDEELEQALFGPPQAKCW